MRWDERCKRSNTKTEDSAEKWPIISSVKDFQHHSVFPSTPNESRRYPRRIPEPLFLRHQLIWCKKHHRQGPGPRCQIDLLLPWDFSKPLSFSCPQPPALWRRSFKEPFMGKPLSNVCLWWQTNANTLGTNSLSWSLNAVNLHHMPSPIQGAGKQGWTSDPCTHPHAWLAHVWSKDFDLLPNNGCLIQTKPINNSERRKGRKNDINWGFTVSKRYSGLTMTQLLNFTITTWQGLQTLHKQGSMAGFQ